MIRRWRLFWTIVKRVNADKIVYAFLTDFFIVSLIFWLVEPSISTLGEGLWYTFVACTSIGFGDIVPATMIGKLATVVITINEIMFIAIIPGIIVNYYQEVVNMANKETVTMFLDKLEHLPELSQEELEQLSQRVKELRKNG